uniref:CSON007500 protein n=1 Tax=Culicoides sonorensis TaxID=179676 RepID=A0A336KBX1_CULSO
MAKRAHNSDELFELKWNNYSNSITEEIFNIRQNDLLVDLTFCCEGVTIGCHKLLIFACSPVLRKILSQNPSPHPIIYITDIKLSILQALLKYIYQGEVQIAKSDLVAFMKAADSFQIRGLQSKTPIENVAASSSGTEVKKRRKTPFEVGPGTSTAADPLNSMQSDQHESSNLDFSEFENECSFGADGHESVDDRFSGITVQQTMEKLKSFIRSIQNGLDILNEFEANGTLTEERREDLCQAISEFMAKGIIKGGRVGHEMIAEAAIILFPGMFDEDPKSLAESLYNRLGQQTQQRYGAESPEMGVSHADLSDEDFDEFEKPLRELKRRRMRSNLKQIEHDLMIFVARALANIPNKHQDTSSATFIFNPLSKDLSVNVCLDMDCNLQTQALCPVCKEMIAVESVAKRQSKGMKYRFKSSYYVNHASWFNIRPMEPLIQFEENSTRNDSYADSVKQEHDSDDGECFIVPEASYGPQTPMRTQTPSSSDINDLGILTKKLRTVAVTNYRKFRFKNEPIFHVFLRDNDIKGKIQCPECQKWISITLGKSYEGAPRNWISSNFVTHFKGRHSEYMGIDKSMKKRKKKIILKDSYEPFSVKIESSDSEQEILSRFMSRSDETKLVQMKEELQIMANKWKKDFIEGIENVESNSVAMKIRDRGPPKTKVYIGEKGKVVAIVKCNICPKQSRIGYKEKSNGLKSFIKGNYIKHLDSTEIIYIKREESSDSENEATLERIEEDLLNYATKWKSDLLNEIKDIETNFIAQRIRDTSIKTKVYLDQNDKVVTRVKCSICGKYNKISYKERVKGYKSFINSNFMNHYKLHLKKTTLRTKRGYNFFQPMVQIKQENYEDSKDPISTMLVKDSSQFSIVEAATQDKYELAAKYLQMEVDSLETYLMTRRDELQNTARKLVLSVVNNPEFNFVGIQVPCNPGVDLRIDDFGTLNASVITDIVIEIKDEPVDDDDVSYISNSYFEAPQLPEISLTETDSDDKYAKATKLLRVVDVQSYLKQKRSELKHLSFKWMNDVLTNVHLDPQSYEPPGIEVDIDDQGKLFATVNCVFCQRSVRLSYKKYESSEGVKCIFNNNSNFKHFLELAKDIAKGLQYLFNENIVHRDLAARNILVTEDNQAKISDFGLARHCNVNGDYQCTNPGPIPAKWYSPEAIDNKTYTKMSDIWSFGVTMYEIFSYGEAPYQHVKCVEDLINLIKTKPLDKPDKCSVEIYEKLMQPCWKIDPKERPKINQILTTIDELLANFESFNQISTEKPIILPDDYIVKDELQ